MAKTYGDQVYGGTLSTVLSAILTAAANTTFILKGFCISNGDTVDRKVELQIDGKRVVPYIKPIPSGDSLIQCNLNIPITTGKAVSARGEVALLMDYYIWGVNEVNS
jgi:hypothetical protein